jgi:hypothetical protein
MTCGDTFTEGFDGGTMPVAPAGDGAKVTATSADASAAVTVSAARSRELDAARARP